MKFLNISNHPIDKWGEAQRKAAGLTRGVEGFDLPFPQVSPALDGAGVAALATQMLRQVRGIGESSEADEVSGVWAVHLMGEQSFCFLLAAALKRLGYNVVVSTTERVVEEKDGQKVSVFQFVRFRPLDGRVDLRTEAEERAEKAKGVLAWAGALED